MFLDQGNGERRVALLNLSRNAQLDSLHGWMNWNHTEIGLLLDQCGKEITSFSVARCLRTSKGPEGCSTVNAATSFLNIPLLCHAMLSNVLPNTETWSSPKLVTPVQLGCGTIFVESYSPPTPTSTTAASTYFDQHSSPSHSQYLQI